MPSFSRHQRLSHMILRIYGAFTTALIPLLRLKLRKRAKLEPLYGFAVEERFGRYSQYPSQGWVWIHAVSLGETRAAAVLLDKLRIAMPDLKLLLSHGTATGRQEGAKLLKEGDIQVWQPWDDPASTTRFLEHFRPRIGILIETEIWPLLCANANSQGTPLALVNARLSERSLKKMSLLPLLMRPAIQQLSLILAQSQADANRLTSISGKLTQVTGNLKFDAFPDNALIQKGQCLRSTTEKTVVMLASSREGEEQLLLDAIRSWQRSSTSTKHENTTIQWMIVPRHPQRFEQVCNLCVSEGFSISQRSSWTDSPIPADIWIGDSIGEMPLYYGLSDVALLGGSFKEFGGQNLIESLACACPIVLGPHTYNFEQACNEAIHHGAAIRANDIYQAVSYAQQLVNEHTRRLAMQSAATKWLEVSRGATERTVVALHSILSQSNAA
jgi:3-deoxy-D-manno-octulosonic-acid transferase